MISNIVSVYLYVIALVSATIIGLLIWNAKGREKLAAQGALMMPIGSAVTAYGYSGGPDHDKAVLTGDVLFILGSVYLAVLLFRRYRASKSQSNPS